MRPVGLLAVICVIGGCEGTAGDAQVTSAVLSFTSQGDQLALESAPLKNDYAAQYPNPFHHDWMKIEVTSDGRLTVACRTATRTACADSPVLVSVDRGFVNVYDVYNVRLAQLTYTGHRCGSVGTGPGVGESGPGGETEGTGGTWGTGGINGGTAPGGTGVNGTGGVTGGTGGINEGPGSGTPGTGTGSGTPGTGTGSGTAGTGTGTGAPGSGTPVNEGGTGTGPSGGPQSIMLGLSSDPNVAINVEDPGDVESMDGEMCPPSLETACDPAQAAPVFCNALNAGLTQYHLPAYDCTHLNTAPTNQSPPLTGEIHCRNQIVTPASTQTRAQFPGCGTALRTWANNALTEIRGSGMCGASPLVLDLDGDGIHPTQLSDGVQFDLFASGQMTQSAWLGGGDGLLVLDRNNNGLIDDGSELFGDSSFAQSWGDGFQALAQLDSDGDGQVDAHDPLYAELRVWVDANHDGIGPASEWLTLPQAGVASLSTRAHNVVSGAVADGLGNWMPLRAHFVRFDGSRGQLADVYFRFMH
jgi:hypothetical protein